MDYYFVLLVIKYLIENLVKIKYYLLFYKNKYLKLYVIIFIIFVFWICFSDLRRLIGVSLGILLGFKFFLFFLILGKFFFFGFSRGNGFLYWLKVWGFSLEICIGICGGNVKGFVCYKKNLMNMKIFFKFIYFFFCFWLFFFLRGSGFLVLENLKRSICFVLVMINNLFELNLKIRKIISSKFVLVEMILE